MRCLPLAFVLACNVAPSAPRIAIEPAAPTIDDALVARIVEESHGPGDDPITYTWRWSVDGEVVPGLTGDTVPAGATLGRQVWTVEVTPSDGNEDGPPASATVTIANTPPTATATITPSAPEPGEALQAVVTATDRDGDEAEVRWTWSVDGAPADLADVDVPPDRTTSCETWTVEAVADDGYAPSAPVEASVVIGDEAPTVEGLAIEPAAPVTNDTLTAAFALLDADGDAVSVHVTWRVDGVVAAQGIDETLRGEEFERDQVVEVTVIPDDGCVQGTPAVAAVVIGNAIPTAAGARIDPAVLDEDTVATCMGEGFGDADGDPPGWLWEWTVDGVPVATTQTLDGDSFDLGETVRCTAIPWDGLDAGPPVESAPVVVDSAA